MTQVVVDVGTFCSLTPPFVHTLQDTRLHEHNILPFSLLISITSLEFKARVAETKLLSGGCDVSTPQTAAGLTGILSFKLLIADLSWSKLCLSRSRGFDSR
jgi:hypothetical protein